jgi:uncharacterized membrane-anchored protein YjiN (DUF445 family)
MARAAESSLLQEGVMKLIADGARDYDDDDFTASVERAVNDDLQYIRITETVVGAMVGCLLFFAKTLAI